MVDPVHINRSSVKASARPPEADPESTLLFNTAEARSSNSSVIISKTASLLAVCKLSEGIIAVVLPQEETAIAAIVKNNIRIGQFI